MSLAFSNAQLLEYNIENQFFDTEFRMNQLKTLNIEGLIYDLAQVSGAETIFSGIEVFRSGLTGDYEHIYMNGHNFGKGKIQSFSFPEDIYVKTSKYNVEIQIRDTGNLEYLTGDYFSGMGDIFSNEATPEQFVKNFSEAIEISRSSTSNPTGTNNRQLGDFSYSHNLDISFDVGSGNLYPNVNMAHKFTKEMFEKNIDFGFLETGCKGLFGANFKTLKSQNIDMINGTFSLSESFSAANFDPNKDFSIVENIQFQTQDDGYINASYSANIEALSNVYENAMSGAIEYSKTGGFYKTSGVFDVYYPSTSYKLFDNKISESISKSKFDGVVQYNSNFSNNPKNSNPHFSFEYTQNISEDANQVVTVSENGTFIGKGNKAFIYAQSGFNNFATSGQAFSRATGIYQGEYGILYDLYPNSKSYEESELDNTVSYSYQWSDKDIGLNNIIQSKNLNISDQYSVILKNDFSIINQKEIYQQVGNLNIQTLPNRSVDLNMICKKDATYSQILGEMKDQLNTYKPSSSDSFIQDFTYSFNENTNNLSANISWRWLV